MQGIGLLGLLIVVALVFYLMFAVGGKGSAGTALQVQQTVKPQAEQFSGRDSEGKIATDSLTIDTGPKGVVVTSVVPGGAFDKMFGLRANDVIIEIGPLTKDQFQDVSTAKAYLLDEYRKSGSLVVQRGTERVTLPQAPAPGAPPDQRTTPRSQLDGILRGRPDNGVPTH